MRRIEPRYARLAPCGLPSFPRFARLTPSALAGLRAPLAPKSRGCAVGGCGRSCCSLHRPFVMSLYLQQHRGLSAPQTGAAFLPMMLIGLVLTPLSARLVQHFGARPLIVTGLVSMAAGLAAVAALPASAPVPVIAALMVLVGLAGPLVAPPVTAVLLSSVPGALAGTASGVFNTSRQVGGALAVAVFGALLAQAYRNAHQLAVGGRHRAHHSGHGHGASTSQHTRDGGADMNAVIAARLRHF
ncbi:MFS transporter [Pseudomonas aeruginosa]|uniref:MFS transporter n=1 Tax=Pseudomonas aeruginosa TaxID=287 RepID=UPI002B27AD80|nr:MFS transporter [Pseudomonas aeruginosa]